MDNQNAVENAQTTAEAYWAKCKAYVDNLPPNGSDQDLWDKIRMEARDEWSSEDGACYFWTFADGSSLAYHECAEGNGWTETGGTDLQAIPVDETPAATAHFSAILDYRDGDDNPDRPSEVQIGEDLATPQAIRILWSGDEHRAAMAGADPICEYRFATKELLEAFMQGVDAADGYLGYEVVE
jgi:hypothetical protein